jgi:carboxyl-terminal processing protease
VRKLSGVQRYIVPAAIALVAFALGVGTMYVLGNEGLLTVVAKSVQMLPGVMKVEGNSSIPAATDLQPLQTFWEVRDRVRKSFVYPVEDDAKLTYGAIRGMLASLDDPWTRFYTPEQYKDFQTETDGHFDGIGAVLEPRQEGQGETEVVISSLIPEGPAAKADIRPQDVIAEVDGVPTKGLSVDVVVNRIRGPRGSTVKLGLRRAGSEELVQVSLQRAEIIVPNVEHKMLEHKIGWVWLRSFNKPAEAKLREAIEDLKAQGAKGLILDLSIDGGGLLDVAIGVGSMFIEKGPIVYVQERGAEPEPLNAFGNPIVPANIPVVVLVDHSSASASEIVAGALQDTGRALVVGQNTFGKSKVQSVMELNDKSALVLSTAVYLTPKKRDISKDFEPGKRGVKPDRIFPEPDLTAEPKIKFEDWHNQEIAKAAAVVKEQMDAKPATP